MKRNRYLWVITLIVAFLAIAIPGYSQYHPKSDTLFQTSTISALLEGVYDGETTFKALKQSGDFGLGTFDALDGEMIGLEGKFYQIKTNGVAYPVKDLMKTPFATVTFFQPQQSILLKEAMNYEQLQQYLDRVLPTKNIPCAIRIKGFFQSIKVRSVPKQTLPYPHLNDVVKNQSIFELRNVKGTLVGFRMPHYMQGVNVAGYHFHLLTQDRKAGGHLLDCQLQNVRAEIDYTPEFKMVLPNNDEFRQVDLGDGKPVEVDQVER
jgi:acetolactate decarboxylase